VVSTEAILTEATHLLGRVPKGREVCLDFFLAGGATLVPASLSSLRRCRALMEKYADCPMDYADATLVILAEDLGTDLVFTTDRRDFEIYRFGGDRPFRILPSLS
jgi:predicted nucleic acid-binding protein